MYPSGASINVSLWDVIEKNFLTRSRGGPATGSCGTRASEQAGKALRSQGHQCAPVM